MSCFYNNYNYNLNNQLSTFGTASRIGGLFAGSNTNVFGNIFGNGFGGYGNYGMFGGFGNYGMFGGFNNCGCGMSPGAQIGFSIANSFTTVFGMLGISALSNKIQSSLAEKRQPANVDTKESVGKELSAQLKILKIQDIGIDNVTTSDIDAASVLEPYNKNVTDAKKEIEDAKSEVNNSETGLAKTQSSLSEAKDNLKTLQGYLTSKQYPEGKTEESINKEIETLKKTITNLEDAEKRLKARKASYEEGGDLYKKLEKAEQERETIKTAQGEAKTLLAKYEKLKNAEQDAAKARQEAADADAMNKADKTIAYRSSQEALNDKLTTNENGEYEIKENESLTERNLRRLIYNYRKGSVNEKIKIGKLLETQYNSLTMNSELKSGVDALIRNYKKINTK